MKISTFLLFSALVMAAAQSDHPAEQRILFIGNSFMYFNQGIDNVRGHTCAVNHLRGLPVSAKPIACILLAAGA
jgi:hypothetical protein